MNRVTATMTAIALSLLLGACGGGDGQTPQTEPGDSFPQSAPMGQDAPADSMQQDPGTPGAADPGAGGQTDMGSPDTGSEQGAGGQP